MVRTGWAVALALTFVGAVGGRSDAARGVSVDDDGIAAELGAGTQHLVVIAANRYEHWMPLLRATPDARAISEALVSRYRVDAVHELYDGQATRANIIGLFTDLQGTLDEDDSVLILYAGHGYLDRASGSGFWIPVDAGPELQERSNWLPHAELRGLIAGFRARHVLVISDSCFAGDLIYGTRSLQPPAEGRYLREAYARVARQVLTSGAGELVPDDSAFARRLVWALERNERPVLDANALYSEVRQGAGSTVALLGALAGTGHEEGASFLLFLGRGAVTSPTPIPSVPAARTGSSGVRARRVTLSAGMSVGWLFTAGAVSRVLTSGGPSTFAHLDAELPIGRCELAAGLLAGVIPTRTATTELPAYSMYSFPLAATLRFAIADAERLALSLEAAVGAAASIVTFLEDGPGPLTVLKPMAAATFRTSVRLAGPVRVSALARFVCIFFDESALTGISPAIGIEYAY